MRRVFGSRGAREFDQRLEQPGHALDARRLIIPVAQIDELLVGAQTQPARLLLDQLNEPDRIGETVAAQRDHRAFRPGLDLLDPGLAAQRLIAMICSRFSTSAGSGPKRSISSAAKASISRRSASPAMRR